MAALHRSIPNGRNISANLNINPGCLGKNDYIFPTDGAYSYQRDLKDVEFHLLDTGQFALEEEGEAICASLLQTTSVNSSRHDCNPLLPN